MTQERQKKQTTDPYLLGFYELAKKKKKVAVNSYLPRSTH
jgi:hypothetical protein